ncbi:MAG: cell division protein ZipA C-terminal FtsZ-binding domain-containing protein [Pseudomonadota bacterium]
MEDLRWILLGLGALVLLGLFLFSRKRQSDAGSPFGEPPAHDPLDVVSAPRRRSEPMIEDITGWTEEGTGPVRRRLLDDDVVPERPPRRAPRFGYEAAPRDTQASLPLGEGDQSRAVWENAPRSHEEPAVADDEPPPVVPLYLVARQVEGFAGSALLASLARHGFEFGEMGVYHHADSSGHVLFSLMNGVAPGVFDPAALAGQRTPALALFLRLPIPASQPGLVFELFLDIAHRLADELDGVLLDERREELSSEAIDRMRETALG